MLDSTLYLHERFSGHVNAHKLQPPDKLSLAHFPFFANGAYIHPDMDNAILLYFLFQYGLHLNLFYLLFQCVEFGRIKKLAEGDFQSV